MGRFSLGSTGTVDIRAHSTFIEPFRAATEADAVQARGSVVGVGDRAAIALTRDGESWVRFIFQVSNALEAIVEYRGSDATRALGCVESWQFGESVTRDGHVIVGNIALPLRFAVVLADGEQRWTTRESPYLAISGGAVLCFGESGMVACTQLQFSRVSVEAIARTVCAEFESRGFATTLRTTSSGFVTNEATWCVSANDASGHYVSFVVQDLLCRTWRVEFCADNLESGVLASIVRQTEQAPRPSLATDPIASRVSLVASEPGDV